MSLPLSVIVLGGGLVGLRMLRGPLLQAGLRNLSQGKAPSFPPSAEFRMPVRLEDLRTREPSLSTAFTASPLLVRRDAPGKVAVFELTTGIRRVRRLLAVRPMGPEIAVVAIPSPSDLVNLLTMALVVVAVGAFAGAAWPFWLGMGVLLAADAWLRLRLDAEAIARQLGKLAAPAS